MGELLDLIQLEGLIGTETCSYCGSLTECLSLPEDGDENPRNACQDCIEGAFADYWEVKGK